MTEQLSADERMSQFRELMSDIVGKAIAQNNEELSQTIGKDVQEMVIKEMNYLMREQETAQEERYRKLDAAIRGGIQKRSLFVHNKPPLWGTKKARPKDDSLRRATYPRYHSNCIRLTADTPYRAPASPKH